MTSGRLRILGIPGSVRRRSYNRGLLEAAAELAPDGIEIQITDLASVPMYNADVEDEGVPPSVQAFRAQIAAADALLIATPEYNHMLPGVLKNAIDWATGDGRSKNPLQGKPAAIMGASSGIVGTARAQLALRQVLASTECYVLPPSPQILVGGARDRFDPNGRLTDEPTRKRIRLLLEAFREWIDRLRPR